MVEVLSNSDAVRAAIADIFSTNGKRIAISAFVGKDAEAYLPRPEGIRLICWPKAGGTNPDALRKLKKLGVDVQFADNVHMKVYWSQKGAVVTSANLSTNAFGLGNLREFGVRLPASTVMIDALVKSLHPRPYTGKEIKQLDRKSESVPKDMRSRCDPMSYPDWFSLPDRRSWRVGWATGCGPFSKQSKLIAQHDYLIPKPKNMITGKKSAYCQGDYILSFLMKSGQRKPLDIEWIYAQRVLRVKKSDKSFDPDSPYEAVQFSPARCNQPPFKLDPIFKKAFALAIQSPDCASLEAGTKTKPPKVLLDLIATHYRQLEMK
jgi:hypothetical protein